MWDHQKKIITGTYKLTKIKNLTKKGTQKGNFELYRISRILF